jgi:hypothetical protein
MKKVIRLLFTVVQIGFAIVSMAQEINSTDSIFYYYKGSKLYLPLNTDKIVVYYNSVDTLDINKVLDGMCIVEDVMSGEKPYPNLRRLLIDIGEHDFENAINTLQGITNVVDVEPVVGVDIIKKVSRRFYVKLKGINDFS